MHEASKDDILCRLKQEGKVCYADLNKKARFVMQT